MRQTLRQRRRARRALFGAGLIAAAALLVVLIICVINGAKKRSLADEIWLADSSGENAPKQETGGVFTAPKSSARTAEPDNEILVSVYDADKKRTAQMPLEEYVFHVVAAEMPASYNAEALKAQAVAVRTFTCESMTAYGGGGCQRGDGADICTDSGHCQAYVSDDILKSKWGASYDFYKQKLTKAVSETAGEIILYDGEPILALFHSSSGGMTENVEEVFLRPLPYLKSVSSLGEEDDSHYEATATFSAEQIVRRINEVYSKAKLTTENLKSQLKITERTGSGRVKTVKIGATQISGVQMRKLLKLNSANFTITFSQKNVIFTTIGWGHGVGMSQVGANAMAKNGDSYSDIITHYYNGVQIGEIPGY